MTIAPKKILLIHNNSVERGKLAIMLSRFGHDVRFSSGRGCTDQMLMSNDLVIIDDQLDKKSGLDIINQISANLCEKVIYLASRPFLAASMELQNLNILEILSLKMNVFIYLIYRMITMKRSISHQPIKQKF